MDRMDVNGVRTYFLIQKKLPDKAAQTHNIRKKILYEVNLVP